MLTNSLKDILDDKLWSTAKLLISYYKKRKYTVSQFQSIDDKYTYRLHLILKKKYETIGIEIRERCNIENYLENQINGWHQKRISAKIYFAVPEFIGDVETATTHSQIGELKRLGIGLIIIKENKILVDVDTVGCHRRFAIENGTSLGKYKQRVDKVVNDYNLGDCLSAVKELTEIVEEANIAVAIKAIKKGKINLTLAEIENNDIDWAGIIECLGIRVYKNLPQTQIIDKRLRIDLHDYRDTRNLSAHWKSKKKLAELEEQYPEAIQTGIRLLRRLISLQSKV